VQSNFALNEHGSFTLSWTDSLNGVRLARFREIISSGESATTAMSASKIVIENQPYSYKLHYSVIKNSKNPDYQRYRSANWSLLDTTIPGIPVSSIDAKVLNDAQIQWNKKIYDTFTQFQGGVFLFELRQALSMLYHPAKSLRAGLRHYLESLRKGRKLTRAQALKYLADSWLEYVFGIRPLLSDIEAATRVIKNKKEIMRRELVRVSGSSGEQFANPTYSSRSAATYSDVLWRLETKRGAAARYSGAIKATCNPNDKLLLASGFAPSSFLPTLWEVIPWSFVIDYFSSVGAIVESLANQSLSLGWGSLTTRKILEINAIDQVDRYPTDPDFSIYQQSFTPGIGFCRRTSISRVVVDTIPVPDLSFRLPGYPMQWLNLAALAASKRSLTPFHL
jgi:hypothetical protein